MRSRVLTTLTTMLALTLAGCAGDSGGKEPEDPTVDLGLEATDTTGVIRGVVVDDAIRPIAGVQVRILSENLNTTTNAEGAFGFDGLEAGTYFLQASKLGFSPVQQSADVIAGESQPPITKILLQADTSFVQPYYEQYVLEGFIQCGVTTSAVAGAICSIPNGCFPGIVICATNENFTEDRFNLFIPVDRVPDHVQHEVVWEATQQTGTLMRLAMRTATAEEYNAGSYGSDIRSIAGPSPLLGVIDADDIEDEEIGVNGTGLAPAVFTGGMDGGMSNGAAVNQQFTMYTHLFFGYTPPEGWRFSDASTVPPPPQ